MADLTCKVRTSYIEQEDTTVVWRDTFDKDEIIATELVGWYAGEPDDEATAHNCHGGEDLILRYPGK